MGGLVLAGVWLAFVIPVRCNWTGSAPLGVYAVQRHAVPDRDDLVVVCPPGRVAEFGRRRGYLQGGSCPSGTSSILKQAVAIGGDEIELQDAYLSVNGRIVDHSRRHALDSVGRALGSYPAGRYVVRSGELWLLGVHRERSWDSRYFGPVPVASVIGVARPLLTFSEGSQ